MTSFIHGSRSVAWHDASHRQSSDKKHIELEQYLPVKPPSHHPILDTGSSRDRSDTPRDDELRTNANHIPPKSFAASRRGVWRRLFDQSRVGSLLFIWCAFIWLLAAFWPFQNEWLKEHSCTNDLSYIASTQFTPTVVYGNFTIGQAKAMDVAWNMIVGRAAQAFIGFIFYGVVKDVLMRITETTAVPLELFTALAFKPFDLSSMFKMVKALPSCRGWRATIALIWILLSVIYIALIPAINDSMTGYVLQTEEYVVFDNGTRIPVGGFLLPNGTRAYGTWARINLVEKHYTVCAPRDGYQWGFAHFWVTLSVCLSTAWIIGTYGIWLDAQHNSEFVQKGRKMGMHRGIIDTAEAMTEALGPDINAYSDKELEKALKKHPKVMYSVEEKAGTGLDHIRLSFKRAGKLQLSWTRKYGA